MAKYKIIPSSRTIVQSPISIGHKAEKGVEAIEFDLTAWVETYGSGTLTVIMRRWGDVIPYPIALEIDENNKATWTLSDIDTAKAGMAYAQLSYIVGDEVVKKSDIYTFRVMDSLTGEGDPPEAYESWLEQLTHFAAEAMAEVLDIEGIVTDKTLTVDGGIADAKSTGDALALKADKSTTYTKAEVDALIDEVEVETDTTLEIAGAPADAKKTGDELSALKADLATLADVTPIPDNSDLNDYVNTGLYTIENGNYTILHYPTDTVVASYLEVTALTTGYIAQKMTFAGLGTVYVRRRYSNGNWNEWIQIAEISNDLMTPGKAADSKKTGDAINALRDELGALDTGLSYTEKSRILYLLENANYKSDVKENLEELRKMFGVINVPYMHVTSCVTKLKADDNVPFKIMEMNSVPNSLYGAIVSTQGTNKLVYDTGESTSFYPVPIPKGVKYVTYLNNIENNLAVSYHIVKWNAQESRWERVNDTDWYYSNLDGAQFYFDVHEWSDGSYGLVSTVCTSDEERAYSTQYPDRMYQHGCHKTSQNVTEAELNKLVLEFV